jgi:putative serine/threonine protein kinase
MNFSKVNQIAKGWSSYIWIVKNEKGNEFVLKEVREKSPRKDLAEREGKMLLLANSVGVGPRVVEINYEKNFVIMEHINGVEMFDWVLNEGKCKGKSFENEVSAEQLYFFIKKLYKQLYALEKIHLSHNQLQIGKNILVEKKVDEKTNSEQYFPTIIDFEKATIKPDTHTKNVGQVDAMLFYNPNGAIGKKVREKLNLYL